jgi:hypothetical protein
MSRLHHSRSERKTPKFTRRPGFCPAYLAKTRGEPLLFKGDDFARTDLATV